MEALLSAPIRKHPSNHESIKLLDDRLTLYQRPDGKIWWAGSYNNRIHIRASTKTADFVTAKAVATKWYFEKQLQIAGGNAPTSKAKGFRTAAAKAISESEHDAKRGQRTVKYVDGLKTVFNVPKDVAGDIKAAAINQSPWNNTKQRPALPDSENVINIVRNLVRVGWDALG